MSNNIQSTRDTKGGKETETVHVRAYQASNKAVLCASCTLYVAYQPMQSTQSDSRDRGSSRYACESIKVRTGFALQ